MKYVLTNRFNPNPITKFFVVGLVGFTVLHTIDYRFEWLIVAFISLMYFINGYGSDAAKNIIVFTILLLIPNFTELERFPIFIKMILSLLFILRMFYIPFSTGRFLIKTSDVGSIISSLDFLRIPDSISIPVAVIFRFFPSFTEEKNNIKMAMKIRGIKTKNPLKYLEYIIVPLLIISSNIADDISKAAETKCIESPIKKTRYMKNSIKFIDFMYAITIFILVMGGWIC